MAFRLSALSLRSSLGSRLSSVSARSPALSALAAARAYSSAAPTEDVIKAKLTEALQPSQIQVVDTSGGCGSFFNIAVISKKFNGLSKVKQHKLVQDLLKDEVANMHGLSLQTVPEEDS